MAHRLEEVRQRRKIPSLREFWRQLGEAEGSGVGYEAVRKYHYDRDAPASYLARVTEVFPEFRLDWLATGRGHSTHGEEAAARAARKGPDSFGWVREELPFLQEVRPSVTVAVIDLVLHAQLAAQAVGTPFDGKDFLHWLEDLLKAPLNLAGDGGDLESLSVDPVEFSRYLAAFVAAVDLGVELWWRSDVARTGTIAGVSLDELEDED